MLNLDPELAVGGQWVADLAVCMPVPILVLCLRLQRTLRTLDADPEDEPNPSPRSEAAASNIDVARLGRCGNSAHRNDRHGVLPRNGHGTEDRGHRLRGAGSSPFTAAAVAEKGCPAICTSERRICQALYEHSDDRQDYASKLRRPAPERATQRIGCRTRRARYLVTSCPLVAPSSTTVPPDWSCGT